MNISVIIPVFNAENFVRQAVMSALNEDVVSEVILIEDKSPDNALAVCKELEREFEKVKLFQHPNCENRGASASRNLGIKKATYEYIAFLDADDFFAPQRFIKTIEIFKNHPKADGVYEAIGIFKGTPEEYKIYSILKPIKPNLLFHYLIRGTYGHFSTDGLTVKKSLFEKSGFFNESLALHQDAELWLRMAYFGKLYAGNLSSPIAYARRHEKNRVTHADRTSILKYWKTVRQFYLNNKISFLNSLLINRQVAKYESTTLIGFYKSIIRNSFNN